MCGKVGVPSLSLVHPPAKGPIVSLCKYNKIKLFFRDINQTKRFAYIIPDLSSPSRIAASATALAMAARMDPAFNSKRLPSCSKFNFASTLFFAGAAAATVLALVPPGAADAVEVKEAMAPGGSRACQRDVRISCEAVVNRRKLNNRVANSLQAQ